MNPTEALRKLSARGWSDEKIAAAVKVSGATVGRVRRGTHQTTYDIGKRMIDLANAIDIIPGAGNGT